MTKIIFPLKLQHKEKLLEHLRTNWTNNHILLKNKKIFNWMYKFKNSINFLTVFEKRKIISSIGLLFNSYNSLKKKNIFYLDNQVIWLTMWSSSKNSKNSGLNLIYFLIKKTINKSIIGTVGCSLHAYKIYKALGFKCGYLKHYFFFKKKKKVFNLIKVNFKRKNNINFKKNKNKLIFSGLKKSFFLIHDLKKFQNLYKKNFRYFLKKYEKNKFYKYKFIFLKENNKVNGFFVTREIKYLNSKCLRLIEYFGNFEKSFDLKNEFQRICDNSNFEFIDFYNYGIKKNILLSSGFLLNNFSNKLIIPNYFSPFVMKNIKLRFAYYPPNKKMLFFKGDCDQDRPN